jgi:broad specificity phosphatase PhoE
MIVYLIRHGDNESLGNYLPGQKPGLHLNENGKTQAESIGISLTNAGITAIVSSPLERAIETAQPLSGAINLPIRIDHGVIEMDTGDFTGVPFNDLNDMESWAEIRKNPAESGFPGGERFETAGLRVWNSIQKLHENSPTEAIVAIFTHADCIKMILTCALQLPLTLFPRIHIDPASLSIIGFRKETIWIGGVNLPVPYHLAPFHHHDHQAT